MNAIRNYLNELYRTAIAGWNRFWFQPSHLETVCLLRVLAGLMLLYTHFVWTFDLSGFFGSRGRVSGEFANAFHQSNSFGTNFGWSFLFGLDGSTLWVVHVICLVILLAFTLGFLTRITSVLAFLITVSYANRAVGALFGLDQINGMLAMYLMLAPCGQRYSLDAFLSRGKKVGPEVSVMANLSTRLIQVHLCMIYFFAAIGKLLGATWWEGSALWLAFANYEYQTIDMTWLASFPLVINALSQFTVIWELTYSVLVWNRLTRPIIIALAVPLHLGIAFCMGMITFGLVMLIANMAFFPPTLTRNLVHQIIPTNMRR